MYDEGPDIYALMNERTIPYGVDIELTSLCNIDCVHCYHVAIDRPEMSTEEVISLFDDLAELGTMEVTLSGGEPLLRNDFRELVTYAVKAAGFSIKIFSNLTLLSESMADTLAALPLNTVETSLLGSDEESHDTLAGYHGAFKATLRGIALLKERGVRINAKTVVMKQNKNSLDEMYDLANKLGISFRHDDTIFVESDGSRFPLAHQLPDSEVLRLRTVSGDGTDITISSCNAAKSIMGISPDGSVYPCGPFPVPAGNIRDTSLRDIWYNSPLMKLIRSFGSDDYFMCHECRYSIRCKGCIAMGIGLSAGRKYPCKMARRKLRKLL